MPLFPCIAALLDTEASRIEMPVLKYITLRELQLPTIEGCLNLNFDGIKGFDIGRRIKDVGLHQIAGAHRAGVSAAEN